MLTIDRILSLADSKGITQAFVCKQLGVDRSWLRTVKKQNSAISPERLAQIAGMLGTTVEYLTGETDDPAIPEKEKSPSALDELLNDPDVISFLKEYRDYSDAERKEALVVLKTWKAVKGNS